ncbi:ATP-binding protein [Priestia megaterium]|uniref:ATP-binding protein n=1 Tax=Priestia megaterium TaxID=1404 RepID=UPI001C24C341|nr:ATP-binding protein [Priestia megaterium]MBU8756770.1 ATP-binding protein [Priestia megaterium]
MDTLNLPPYAPVLMEATRAIGYSLETAIADIIDNSVAAKASNVDINFFPIDNPYIAIIDNGIGMDENELINAMRYGSTNPLDERSKNDLGRFGLGLKTASTSQCRKLTVVSKKDEKIVGAQWDLDYIATTGEWSLKILSDNDFLQCPHIKKLYEYNSGTLVLWQELDRLKVGDIDFESNMGKYMDRVREHLSLVFHRYLKGEPGIKKLRITINDFVIDSIDPFLTEKSTQIMDDETIYIEGQRVTVRPYILPHISQLSEKEIHMLGGQEGIRKQQGFYVYRNKRLLVWGTWFKMMRQGDLSKLARVQIDIPNSLDSLWTLDIKKSMAVPPQIVRKNVSIIIEKIGESSKRTWTYRGKKETDNSKVHIWNRLRNRDGGILYEINRDHPLVESICQLGGTERRMIEQLLTQVERGLPLNQLYVDLTSDERMANDSEISKNDLEDLLKELLDGCRNIKERQEMATRLSTTEPFDQHPEILLKIVEGVL